MIGKWLGCAWIFAAAAGTPVPAGAVTFDYTVRANATYEVDGPRDLGLGSGSTADNFLVNLTPRALIEFNPDFTGYVRGRVFLPTGSVVPYDNGQPSAQAPAQVFAGLDELWLEYNGLTNYPGEAFRIGRQQIRHSDGIWIAQNADAIRWSFDTTLLDADLGLIHQFSSYRTDDIPVVAAQRHRTYGFASIAGDWRPGHRLGLRVLHATDHDGLPAPGTEVTENTKLQDADLTWIGAFIDNGYFKRTEAGHVAYRGEISYLFGDDRRSALTPAGVVGGASKLSLGALAATGDIRWRPFQLPLQFGLTGAYSQGGGSHQFQQTGLQSNGANFTGTATLINRYNETLRAELGNLRVIGAYLSLSFLYNDASLIFENFSKDDRRSPIVTDNVTAITSGSSRDVGNGLDLVLTHYFNAAPIGALFVDDEGAVREQRASLRLRSSLFNPGAAYDSQAKLDYRVLLECTIWLF